MPAHSFPSGPHPLPAERPAPGPATLRQQAEARARMGKGSTTSGLTFPPLCRNFNSNAQEASWPGAEYTRRTRMKTKLDPTYSLSQAFTSEMEELLGDTFSHWQDAMKPTVRPVNRGNPPPAGPKAKDKECAIQPSYVLRRAEATEDSGSGSTNPVDLKGTTMALSGHISKSRANETSYTKFGPVPAYLFEDREHMDSLSSWFEAYGRPTPNAINLGPRQVYTHYQNSSKRCCGEPSNVQIMKKGFITN